MQYYYTTAKRNNNVTSSWTNYDTSYWVPL